MKTSEAMDTELMNMLDAEDGWYGITKYAGKYHIEHQGGRIGPFFSVRGALLAYDQKLSGAYEPEPTLAIIPPIEPPPLPDWFTGQKGAD